jgi:putative acetyltransferase
VTDAQARNAVIDLWCFEENLAARAFYASCGFVEVGRTDGSGNSEKRPDIHFRWTRKMADRP